ncbi:MAG: hypothetical protein Q4D16_15555 [Eubacteriales bacterium]|nr:hypothetical protein [Eubacteriales bacterium]
MKEEKLVKLSERKKKKQILTGTLSLPLRVGERAWICYGSHTITTTPVVHIWEVSTEGILFETRNTVYELNYIFNPNTEVMCA